MSSHCLTSALILRVWQLAIGWYESGFLSKLVVSYLFVRAKNHSSWKIYRDIYQDDAIVVFKVKNKIKDIKEWLNEFQRTMNKLTGNQHLQFTTEICKNNKSLPPSEKNERVKISAADGFLFLDMNMRVYLLGGPAILNIQ